MIQLVNTNLVLCIRDSIKPRIVDLPSNNFIISLHAHMHISSSSARSFLPTVDEDLTDKTIIVDGERICDISTRQLSISFLS